MRNKSKWTLAAGFSLLLVGIPWAIVSSTAYGEQMVRGGYAVALVGYAILLHWWFDIHGKKKPEAAK